MPLADEEERARERVRHIDILRRYANDPANPRRATHRDELNKMLVAQRAYENTKRRGHPDHAGRPQQKAPGQPSHPSLPRPVLLDRMGPSTEGRKVGNKNRASARLSHKGSAAAGRPRDPSSANGRISTGASSAIHMGWDSGWGREDTGRSPSFSPAFSQPQRMPEQIPVTVGTGHSVLSAQRLHDVVGVSGPTWTGAQALTVLIESGWREVFVTVSIVDNPLSAPPPAPLGDTKAAVARAVKNMTRRDSDDALTAPMRYGGRPSSSHNANGYGCGGSAQGSGSRSRSGSGRSSHAQDGASSDTSRSSSARWGHDKFFLDSTRGARRSQSKARYKQRPPVQPQRQIAQTPRTGGNAKMADATRNVAVGSVHPSRLGMVPGTTGPSVANGSSVGCGTQHQSQSPSNETPPTMSQSPMLESPTAIVTPDEEPILDSGLTASAVGSASEGQLIGRSASLTALTPLSPMSLVGDEELEECPSPVEMYERGAKRKRSETPGVVADFMPEEREARPVVTKKMRRNLC